MTATQSAPACHDSRDVGLVDAPDGDEGQIREVTGAPDAVKPDGLTRALADGGGRKHRAHRDIVHAHRHRLHDLRVRVVRAADQLAGSENPARNVHREVRLSEVNAVGVTGEAKRDVVVHEEERTVVVA